MQSIAYKGYNLLFSATDLRKSPTHFTVAVSIATPTVITNVMSAACQPSGIGISVAIGAVVDLDNT